MKPVLVLYATREGHTRRVAEHVAATLLARGLAVDVLDVSHLPEDFSLASCAAAILAASVHLGRHEREMVAFVKDYRTQLERLPTAFLSVSLTEASVEDPSVSPEIRAKAAADVQAMLDAFFDETAWHPDRVRPVAGALLYREYGLIVRFVMKQIAKRAGGDTDTSRNHEYTDWKALDAFVEGLPVARAPAAPRPAKESPKESPPEAPHPHHHEHQAHVISPASTSGSYLNPGAVTIRR